MGDTSPAGELVVLNGKHRGTRLPLCRPVVVVGSADGCDIRLTASGVGAVHCLLAASPAGPVVRVLFPDSTAVNGGVPGDRPLVPGDELRVGPCTFRFAHVGVETPPPAAQPAPVAETVRLEAAQLADSLDERQRQVAALEAQLAAARDAFRRERDATREEAAVDRREAAELNAAAKALHHEAARERTRLKRLAARVLGRLRRRWADARRQLDSDRAALGVDRGGFEEEAARFRTKVEAFHTSAAVESQRVREAWAAVEAAQHRAAEERAEASAATDRREHAVAARSAELDAREQAIGAETKKAAAELAALKVEVAGLEARAQNARDAVRDLERQRGTLLAGWSAPKGEPSAAAVQVALNRAKDRDLGQWAAELDRREQQLQHDQRAVQLARADLDRAAADIADRRGVLAEQFGQLAAARAGWQAAELRSVQELEDLTRALGHRERELEAAERAAIRADRRRRETAYDLWQMRLKLEGWQSALAAQEARSRTYHDRAETALAARRDRLARREGAVNVLFRKLADLRREERERLTSELRHWADQRADLAAATADYDRLRADLLRQSKSLAARELAVAEAVAEAARDSGSDHLRRRFEVARKRWEQTFDHRLREIEARREAADADRADLDARYRELHALLAKATERAGEVLRLQGERAAADALVPEPVSVAAVWAAENLVAKSNAELAVLRDEVDRMAVVLMTAEPPEPAPDDLPWAADVLPFTPPGAAAA